MAGLPINILDGVILLVVGLSALIGLFRGFVREVLSLAAWFGAGWVALTFYGRGAALVRTVVDDALAAGVIAGGVLFIGTLIVLMLLAGAVSGGVRRASLLGPADRTLGLLFGVLRGAVIVALGFIAIAHLVSPKKENPAWVESSRLLPHVKAAASLIERLVPAELNPADRKVRQKSPGKTRGQGRDSGTDSARETGYTARQRQQIPNLLERQPAEQEPN
ncbi:MAG: CvpA family protein [Alphaproteobacteria bacterium]|nr:CvpA family protein [Alphaproteobacteria bacterium]